MKLITTDIQGNIFTSEVLEKVRMGDIRYQSAKDFNLQPNESIRDEISNAWSLLNTHWKIFKQKRETLMPTDTGTTITRGNWMQHFFTLLGYEVGQYNAEIINDKSYAISHRAGNKDGFPIHIIGFNQSLDKRVENGVRLSPHALMQEYINNTEYLYGYITNGLQLRILRDATHLSKLSYLEFNLEQMMEEGHFNEFALLYRLLHATRIANSKDESAESILEFYHNEAIASGARIREKLSEAVEKSIILLADGLLKQPQNEGLRDRFENEYITAKEYYLAILRLIYRILFLLVIEERRLVYKSDLTEDENKLREYYYKFYSIQRITQLVDKSIFVDAQKIDLWQSINTTFRLFEDREVGKKLGISALSSGIFSIGALSKIEGLVLNNKTVLNIFKHLVTFENDNKQRIRVNYADLDVEEFGSIYEGLLEYEPVVKNNNFSFIKGKERSDTGSHYTPEELVKPLIEHSLDYVILEKLKEPNKEEALLSINVCDVACGSGHILLSAARRIGYELAKVRSKEDQPTPPVVRSAVRDTIRNCIYGVDLNPLAVELCKVAMWLEAHVPGEPLNFLDHRIKQGNAIVGLAHREELENGIPDEAFKKALPGDDKDILKTLRDKNRKERSERSKEAMQLKAQMEELTTNSVKEAMEEYRIFNKLPESTPDEIKRKERAYRQFLDGKGYGFLKNMADLQLAPFFIPKTDANKDKFMTDADYMRTLSGWEGLAPQKVAMAMVEAQKQSFFHWFLEFPEVYSKRGFDCILGNPPFLGGQKISGTYGDNFLESIKYQFAPIGAVDLVTYFFRRNFSLIKTGGFISLISTNTIAQGRAREDGLDIITGKQGGIINHAVKSMKWPGKAAVEVSLVTITKHPYWDYKYILNGKEVKTITPYLDDAEASGNPHKLKQNEGKSFQGSIVLGLGFVLEPHEAEALIAKDPRNKDVLFPYLNGNDLNNNPDQSASRWVINFFDWTEEKAKTYPDCYKIVEEKVKPERLKSKGDRGAEYWWQFLRMRKELYQTIEPLERVLVVSRVSKYLFVNFTKSSLVFADQTFIFPFNSWRKISIIQSIIHDLWAWKTCSTMGAGLRYTASSAFETFPFPQNLTSQQEQQLEQIGEAYHEHRRQLMLGMQLGLTKTYNAFHNPEISSDNEKWFKLLMKLGGGTALKEIKLKDYKFNKESANLIKHFMKDEATISLREAVEGIEKLRKLHVEMDLAVLEAYGWRFDSAQRPDIDLRHNYYEVDYLPENDRVRFTIHPDARKEVLKRLLLLNHKLYADEVKAGLHDKKGGRKKKANYKTKASKNNRVSEDSGYFSGKLFDEPNLFNQGDE